MSLNELTFLFVPFNKFVFLGFLQKQLSEGKFALLSCEELLEFANNTLDIADEEEFLKVGVEDGCRGPQ